MLANSFIALRAPEPEDLSVIYKWENNTSLWQYSSTIAPFSRYILKEYIASGGGDFYQTRQLRLMIIDKQTDICVGMVDLFDFDPFHRRAAVGILTDSQWQQKGFAYEALKLMHEYAFGFLGIHALYAHVPICNVASNGLFHKAGYETKGILKDWIRIGQRYEDVAMMQLLKKDN